jgi:DivIVA domain-containing protein
VDRDDPAKRIAELERQLAEHIAELGGQQAEPVNSPAVTPADVHSVAFSKPPMGQRGDNEDEVDAFLDRLLS